MGRSYGFEINRLRGIATDFFHTQKYVLAASTWSSVLERYGDDLSKRDIVTTKYNIGVCYIKLKDGLGALRMFEEALEEGIIVPGLFFNMGVVHYSFGNYFKAYAYIRKEVSAFGLCDDCASAFDKIYKQVVQVNKKQLTSDDLF